MARLLVVWIVWMLTYEVHAGVIYDGGVVIDKVVKVYDGDTVTINISAYPAVIGSEVKVRLRGIDTPELRGKCDREKALAISARLALLSKLSSASTILLTEIGRGSFFRLIGVITVDGLNLNKWMVDKGYARKYRVREGRRSWCD